MNLVKIKQIAQLAGLSVIYVGYVDPDSQIDTPELLTNDCLTFAEAHAAAVLLRDSLHRTGLTMGVEAHIGDDIVVLVDESELTNPSLETFPEQYNPLQVKADRYDYIMRWFKNDLKYKLGCGEDESLGVIIDDKIEEDEVKDEERRARMKARDEAAGK